VNRDEKFRAKVRALWATGDSCLTIAGKLGVTKGVITGLAFRMKLPIRPKPSRPSLVARGDLVASRAKKPTVALLKPAHREIQAMHPLNDNGRTRKMGPLTIAHAGIVQPVAFVGFANPDPKYPARPVERQEAFIDRLPIVRESDDRVSEPASLPVFKPRSAKFECQYPTTMPNGKHQLLCEAMATNGPYCAEHRAICWVPTKAQRESRA
jgi:hypothetical protein